MALEVVLATANKGKQREFAQVLEPLDWRLHGLDAFNAPDVEETGLTFVENAMLKARSACEASGMAALADDSGLVVPFLNGEPGIYSARYGGQHGDGQANIARLLSRLEGAEDEQRAAYFYTALVLLRHAADPTPVIALGRWDGHILQQQRGSGGFGYDPIFQALNDHRSAAELSADEKNRQSHRGRAVQHLLQQLSAA